MSLRVLSLFAGIGGLDLGLERAGMRVVGQVEIDPFCRAVLAKHWPGCWRHDDVRTLTGSAVEGHCGPIDLVCGGVPCQPASCAGKRKGAADERWLWPEFVRVVREVRPSWFLAENVRGWLTLPESRGVVGELEGAGFAVRCLLLGARHVGAPHRRDRIWIVGRMVNAECGGLERPLVSVRQSRQDEAEARPARTGERLAHAHGRGLRIDGCAGGRNGHADEQGPRMADAAEVGRRAGRGEPGDEAGQGIGRGQSGAGGAGLAHAEEPGPQGAEPARDARAGGRAAEHGGAARWPARPGEPQHEWEEPRLVYPRREPRNGGEQEPERFAHRRALAGGPSRCVLSDTDQRRISEALGSTVWLPEPALGSAASRLPGGLAGWRRSALQALGNAVVPQVAEVIGRAIVAAHTQAKDAA